MTPKRQRSHHIAPLVLSDGKSVFAGNSVKKSEGKQTTEQLVLSNGYATDAPLPRPRPDLEENRHVENSASPLYQNDGHEVNEQRDASIVLTNPVVNEALSRSLPRSRSDDFGHLPPAREKRETESDHHHHDNHHLRDDTADGEFLITFAKFAR